MKEILDNSFFQGVVGSLISTGLVALVGYIRLWYLKRKYDYILGDWSGYYLSKDENYIHTIKVEIASNLIHELSILMEEKSEPNYVEKGKIEVIENVVFGSLEGKTHASKGFLMLKLPFNRKGKIPAINGIYSGINQDEFPFSTKIHFSRSPVSISGLKKEFGTHKKYIISDKEATLNIQRKTVMDNLKSTSNKKSEQNGQRKTPNNKM